MKFWKQILLTTFAFFSVTAIIFYTSCAKDPCSTLTCMNGGLVYLACAIARRAMKMRNAAQGLYFAILGTYDGTTTCNATSTIADTVDVYPTTDSTMVVVIQRSNITDTMIGTVSTNASNSTIIVPVDTSANFVKNTTITLNGNQLTVFINEITNVSAGTTSNCTFTGFK